MNSLDIENIYYVFLWIQKLKLIKRFVLIYWIYMFFYFTLSGYLNMMGHKVFPTAYFIILENVILNLFLFLFYPKDLSSRLFSKYNFSEFTFNFKKIDYLKSQKQITNSKDDYLEPIIVLNPFCERENMMNYIMIANYIK